MKQGGLRDCYWLDIQKLANALVRPPFQLQRTKYFTARIAGACPGDTPSKQVEREASRRRQQVFLEAIETLRFFDVIEGHFLLKREHCRACNADVMRPEEKMTDVRIATELLTDAFLHRFDSALIISGDSDLVPPIEAVKLHFPNKSIVVAFPPGRSSSDLAQAADVVMNIWPKTLRKCQLPETVVKRDGSALSRPIEWQ